MTGIQPEFNASPYFQNPWKVFSNGSGETIPPFACMRITGATNVFGEITFICAKPNATEYDFYLVNGPESVPAGKNGRCTTLMQAGYIAYNSGSGTPALAQEWGPKAGQWEIEKNYEGFFICGGIKLTAGINVVAAIQNCSSANLVRFELTDTLTLSGDAPAVLLEDDEADWTTTADEIQVYDLHTPEGMWAGISGYRGWAIRVKGLHASGRPRYAVVWMEQIAAVVQCTATERMGATTANRIAATVNWYDHQGKNPGSTIIARDPQGQFPDVHSGAKFTAVYDYHSSYYRVISSQRVAIFASAALTADTCSGSISIDGFTIKPTGDYVGDPPTAPSTVSNPCGHAGLNDDTVLLRRTNNSMPEPAWEVIDISKHAVEVVKDVQVSGLTLQKKDITIRVEICTTAEPSWETYHTGEDECPPA